MATLQNNQYTQVPMNCVRYAYTHGNQQAGMLTPHRQTTVADPCRKTMTSGPTARLQDCTTPTIKSKPNTLASWCGLNCIVQYNNLFTVQMRVPCWINLQSACLRKDVAVMRNACWLEVSLHEPVSCASCEQDQALETACPCTLFHIVQQAVSAP